MAQCSLLPLEQFTTSTNFSTGTSTTTKYWSPSSCNTGGLLYYSSGGCTGGYIGKTGSWNNYFGCFLRTPQANCTGNTYVTLNFDISNSYFANHPNDGIRFYMWVDNGYKKASQVKIGGVDVGYTDANGLWLKFNQARTCVNVDVIFDLTTCTNLSNILFYLEPNCGYNDANVFSVSIDNISMSTGSLPVADAGENDTICEKTSVQLNATGGTSYSWSPATGLNATNIANPIAIPAVTTTYTVTVSNTCGSATDAVTITVNPTPAAPVITQAGNTLYSSYLNGNQWYFNNVLITGETGISYVPDQTGNYYTIVTDSNGCVSDKSNSIYVVVTGINMLYPDDNLIKISPNPAADKIFVEYNADNPDGMLLIYDLEGRMIINQVLDKKNSEINISGLASGVYFLRVKNETGTLVRKFIKE